MPEAMAHDASHPPEETEIQDGVVSGGQHHSFTPLLCVTAPVPNHSSCSMSPRLGSSLTARLVTLTIPERNLRSIPRMQNRGLVTCGRREGRKGSEELTVKGRAD
jgi:hypothetical protein